jgi:hypothetical protein
MFTPRVFTKATLFAGSAFLLATFPSQALTARHDNARTPAAPASGSCRAGAMAYSISTDLQTTSSKNYRDVSGTGVSFTQGAAGCVEVSFSGEGATTPGNLLVTQAVLDGSTVCLPGDNNFASDSPSSDVSDHAMNFICPNVSAGNHSVKIQFRTRFGGKVALDYRTTIVRYTP